jgi:hypothetical protein
MARGIPSLIFHPAGFPVARRHRFSPIARYSNPIAKVAGFLDVRTITKWFEFDLIAKVIGFLDVRTITKWFFYG